MVIGVANDAADKLILQTPYNEGVLVGYKDGTSGGGLTLKKVFHEGHVPTYSELGTMAYSNLTGAPTIPTDFVSAASGGTFGGNLNVQGNILLTGTATTSNQTRMIDFTGFDKELSLIHI